MVQAIPKGYHTITAALTCKNAAQAIEFYKKAFGATELMRFATPEGSISHAELKIGDSPFFVSDEFQGMTAAPGAAAPSTSLYVYLPNVDEVFDRAVAAGCKVEMPLTNMFYGDRNGALRDPYGHRWSLAQHVEDVAPDELRRRGEEFHRKLKQRAQAAQV